MKEYIKFAYKAFLMWGAVVSKKNSSISIHYDDFFHCPTTIYPYIPSNWAFLHKYIIKEIDE